MQYVAVVSKTNKPLMPCHPARARELVRKGRAVRRFRKGFFYIQLLDREDGEVQPVACGIDPGSKWEGFSVTSSKRAFLNTQADAVTHVKEAVETRRNLRRARRYRKTPCRKPRFNRAIGGIPPSTLSRWDWKLRIANLLYQLFPISVFVVEDVATEKKKGKRKWNTSFSPLEVGKRWFYSELSKIAPVVTRKGYETKALREQLGRRKLPKKSAEDFDAHAVDAWVLAASEVGATRPVYTGLIRLAPLRFRRRSLHLQNPANGGMRRRHGGTVSLGLRRGTQILHPKFGFCYVGGSMDGRLSLHSQSTGKRFTQRAKLEDCTVLCPASWRIWRPRR